jgi:hypothetical protein
MFIIGRQETLLAGRLLAITLAAVRLKAPRDCQAYRLIQNRPPSPVPKKASTRNTLLQSV